MRILEFKFKILNLKTLSAGLFTNRVHGRETLAVSSLVHYYMLFFMQQHCDNELPLPPTIQSPHSQGK